MRTVTGLRCARHWAARMSSSRTLVTIAVAIAVTSCGDSFESDPEGGCVAPTCEGAGPSCRSYNFATPNCPNDWALSGDLGDPVVVAECSGGKLHVAADNTLDVFASLDLETPSLDYSMHVSARIAVLTWDNERMLVLEVGGETPFEIRTEMTPAGNPRYLLCDGTSCPASFEGLPGEEYLFEFDVSAAGTTAQVDCQPLGSLPGVALATSTQLSLVFGRRDAFPIDGTLDDVVVSFR